MKIKFRKLLRKFCLESSIVGLKYFYLYPDLVSRCFWALILLLIANFAGLLTYALYHRYAASPTRINVENQFAPVIDLPFPSVAICTPNQITLTSMRHFNRTFVDGNQTMSLDYQMLQLLGFHELVFPDLAAMDELQNLIELNRYTIPEVMSSLPQSCDRFLKLCYLHGQRHPGCKGLFKPILTQHGLCCIFNNIYYYHNNRRNEAQPHIEPRKVLRAGVAMGLTVVTDFEPEDAADGSVLFAGAARVMVNDWTEFPSNDEFSLVEPHTESFHLIYATYTYCSEDVQSLPPESRRCFFEEERRLPFFNRYHNNDCDMLCFAHAVEAACHCLLYYLPRLRTQQTCNVTSIGCITAVKIGMSKLAEMEECDCPRDCVSRRYRVDMSLGNLDALPYMFANPYRGIAFNKSTSIMHFFFPNSVYVIQKQETVMSFTILASNLGGVFGLCLGCSMMSVIELMFYIYSAARNYVLDKLNKAWRRRAARCRVGYCN